MSLDTAESENLLKCVADAGLLARTYVDAVDWILLFSEDGLERPEEEDENGPGWSPEASEICDGYLLPSTMREAWDLMFCWTEKHCQDDFQEQCGEGARFILPSRL